MGISLDATFGIQIVSFLILWVILQRLLFEPVLGVLSAREARTRGAAEAAEQLHAEAGTLEREYAERLRAVRRAVLAQSEEERRRALQEERAVIAAARDVAAKRLGETRAQIEAQTEAARASLRAEASTLAGGVVAKVLGGAGA